MKGPAIHAPTPIGNSLKACMMPFVVPRSRSLTTSIEKRL